MVLKSMAGICCLAFHSIHFAVRAAWSEFGQPRATAAISVRAAWSFPGRRKRSASGWRTDQNASPFQRRTSIGATCSLLEILAQFEI